jgi:uncharacterized membrane protein
MPSNPGSESERRYGPWLGWDSIIAAGVSLLAALAALSPFFHLGTASGHDITFHMASWLDAAGQWKQGVLLPRWAQWPNYGFGEPRFIFYPPLSWLFGAWLGTFLPWNSVVPVFIVSVQTFAGWSAFALVRRLSDSYFAQLVSAACFAANPYALVIIYARSDFAELLAMAFFPLLFLTMLKLLRGVADRPGGRSADIVAFGLVFCTIWLSNAPAAVISTYTVTFVFLTQSGLSRSPRPLILGAAAMLLGFGLAGFYLVPAIYEQRWVNISGALATGLSPGENFLYAHTLDPEHDAFNHVASNVAASLIVWAFVAAYIAWRRKSLRARQGAWGFSRPILPWLSLAIGLLMLPVTSLLWRLLPELRFVQFPWRWMSILVVCAICLMTASLEGKWRWVWPVALAVLTSGSGLYLVKHTWWDTEDMPSLQAALLDQSGFEGTDEYDPAGDDHTDLPQKQPRARFLGAPQAQASSEREIFVDEWTAERRRLRIVTAGPSRIALRLLDYPAWRIRVNGHQVAAQHVAGTRQMVVPVSPGESRIELQFTRTRDRTLGGWLSVLSLTVSLALLMRRK